VETGMSEGLALDGWQHCSGIILHTLIVNLHKLEFVVHKHYDLFIYTFFTFCPFNYQLWHSLLYFINPRVLQKCLKVSCGDY
jgi:hypothetical protein